MAKIFKRQINSYLICLFFIVFNSPYCFCQTSEEILDRYFKASSNGDIGKWNQVKTLYSTSIGYFNRKSTETPLDSTFDLKDISYHKSYKRWPSELKEELFDDSLFKDHSSSFYFLKNKTIIKLAFMDPIEVTQKEEVMLDFYPIQIHKHVLNNTSIMYKGIRPIPGIVTPSHEIEIKTPSAVRIFFFNPKSFLLDAIYFPEANYYTVISDYRLFDGYLLPTYEVSMRNGITFAWMRYRTFEFNVKFDEHQFDPQYEKKYIPKSLSSNKMLTVTESNLDNFINVNFFKKRVFVDVWATWCSPCKWEFKNYDSAYYFLMEKLNISLLYLSIDKDGDKEKWETDVAELGLKGFHARANRKLIQSIKELIFEGGKIIIPRYILIDRDGRIISKDFMRPSHPRFKEELYKALNMN